MAPSVNWDWQIPPLVQYRPELQVCPQQNLPLVPQFGTQLPFWHSPPPLLQLVPFATLFCLHPDGQVEVPDVHWSFFPQRCPG